MPFTAAAVANEFLGLAQRDGRDITPLKMQKLVYFAHGWHLALFGKPLISEGVQAWEYGPVISSLYQQFKRFGAKPIRDEAVVLTQAGYVPARLSREGLNQDVTNAQAVVDRVWEQYGKFTASQLTSLTHSQNSPWSRVPNKEQLETSIPDALIAEYFREQVAA